MNLRIFLLGLSFFYLSPMIGQNKIKWTSWDLAQEKIQKSNKKFIIYFYYDGCKWCRFMEENTFANDQLAKFVNQNFYTFRINAESTEKISINNKSYSSVRVGKFDFHELAVDLLNGYMSFPAVAFMDEKFTKIQSYDGFIELEDFEMLLAFYAGDHYKNTRWKRYANNYCKESHFNALVKDRK
jgi:thioredoxin-related protein